MRDRSSELAARTSSFILQWHWLRPHGVPRKQSPHRMGVDSEGIRRCPLSPSAPPAEGECLFEIDEEPTEECLTAPGGLPLFVRTARSLDVPGSVKRNLALKQPDRGFDEATCIESFLALNAAGGDCLKDFDSLREDRGVAARKFLYQFHDPEKTGQAQRDLLVGEVSYAPEESAALRGLVQVNQDVVRAGAPLCRRADRDHRHGCHRDRELAARGQGDLRRRQWLSAQPRGHPARCGRR